MNQLGTVAAAEEEEGVADKVVANRGEEEGDEAEDIDCGSGELSLRLCTPS